MAGVPATLPVTKPMPAAVTDTPDTGKLLSGVPTTLPVTLPMPIEPPHLPPINAFGLKTAEIWI
jgi:hypothetical protein